MGACSPRTAARDAKDDDAPAEPLPITRSEVQAALAALQRRDVAPAEAILKELLLLPLSDDDGGWENGAQMQADVDGGGEVEESEAGGEVPPATCAPGPSLGQEAPQKSDSALVVAVDSSVADLRAGPAHFQTLLTRMKVCVSACLCVHVHTHCVHVNNHAVQGGALLLLAGCTGAL